MDEETEGSSFEQVHFDAHYILRVGSWWELIIKDNIIAMLVRKSIGAGINKELSDTVVVDRCYSRQIQTGMTMYGKS